MREKGWVVREQMTKEVGREQMREFRRGTAIEGEGAREGGG